MTTDRHSALPVRTQADPDELLRGRIVDGEDKTKLAQVDDDKNLHVETHGNRADDGADVVLRLSETGAPNTDGVYHADNNSKPAHSGVIVHTRQTTPDDSHCTKRVTGVTNESTHAMDVSLHDEDGKAYSKTNPLHVEIAPASGARVRDFLENADIAKDASANHDYTVAGFDLDLLQVECSSSGKAKFELFKSDDGIAFDLIEVKFNSTANPNCTFDLSKAPVVVPVGGKVRVTKTNRDHDDCSLYSTIIGVKTLSSPG